LKGIETMKKIKMTVIATVVGIMASNTAFSAEYMMCKQSGVTSFGNAILGVKNSPVACEGDDFKQEKQYKMNDLAKEGWKVNHMAAVSNDKDNRNIIYFLMIKE
jgi:hypothetical protein